MNYWKGLLIAGAFDVAWMTGCLLTTDPPVLDPDPPARSVATVQVRDVEEISEIGELEDSLMIHLKGHPQDVAAMERLSEIYMRQGWYDAAIRPLARAIEIEPSRWGLWVALDEAVEKSGRGTISDEELVRASQTFVETFEMWGEGC